MHREASINKSKKDKFTRQGNSLILIFTELLQLIYFQRDGINEYINIKIF
jgi:hypothetical protein